MSAACFQRLVLQWIVFAKAGAESEGCIIYGVIIAQRDAQRIVFHLRLARPMWYRRFRGAPATKSPRSVNAQFGKQDSPLRKLERAERGRRGTSQRIEKVT